MKTNETKWMWALVVIALIVGVIGVALNVTATNDVEARVRERISIDAREDAFLWNSADLYLYSDNHSTQKFHIDGATGDTTVAGTLAVTGATTLVGNLADSGGAFTIADNTMIDGASDAIQLLVQGYTTQTSSLLVLETSAGTDKLTVSNDGNLMVAGTSDLQGNLADSGGVLTTADNVMVDGQADAIQLTVQGYTTQTSSLLVLETSAGTDKLTVSNDGNTDIAGTLQYGANNLYPVGFGTSGQKMVYGTSTITTTTTASHGLTTVTWALCVLGEDTEAGAGDAAYCSVAVSANTVTIKLWQDDATAATETSVVVHWLVVGAP